MEIAWRPEALSAAADRLASHGVVLLRGVYPRAWIERVAATVEALFHRFSDAAAAGGLPPDAVALWLQSAIDLGHLSLDDASASPAFEAPLRDLATAVLGGPVVRHPHSFLRRVEPDDSEIGSGLKLPFHQDQKVLERTLLNAWIPFVDCGVDRPSLEVVARRLDSELPTEQHDRHIYGLAGVEIPADVVERDHGDALWAPELMGGDALLFLGTTIHRSHVTDAMMHHRVSLDLRFVLA